jgi:hypothetical protein
MPPTNSNAPAGDRGGSNVCSARRLERLSNSPNQLAHQARRKAIRAGEIKIGECVVATATVREKKGREAWFPKIHLREIEKVITSRYGQFIPETDDAYLIIEVAAYALNAYCRANGKDIDQVLDNWCSRWCPWALTRAAEILRPILSKVQLMIEPRCLKADTAAQKLMVTHAERTELGLTTIGACDLDPDFRRHAAKAKNQARERDRLTAKRRMAGILPRELANAKRYQQSISAAKPWEAEGVSRATWYRQRAR